MGGGLWPRLFSSSSIFPSGRFEDEEENEDEEDRKASGLNTLALLNRSQP